MRIKALPLGLSAAVVIAIAFGICGIFFTVAPGPTSAFVSWVMHVDVTTLTRPVSAANLVAGIVLFGAYVGLLVGLIAELYNRFTAPRTT
jgi:hypothetical protein